MCLIYTVNSSFAAQIFQGRRMKEIQWSLSKTCKTTTRDDQIVLSQDRWSLIGGINDMKSTMQSILKSGLSSQVVSHWSGLSRQGPLYTSLFTPWYPDYIQFYQTDIMGRDHGTLG